MASLSAPRAFFLTCGLPGGVAAALSTCAHVPRVSLRDSHVPNSEPFGEGLAGPCELGPSLRVKVGEDEASESLFSVTSLVAQRVKNQPALQEI